MSIAIVIPARYGSTRFPGKPLAEIAGQSMLSRVIDLAREASQGIKGVEIFVASEDERIVEHAKSCHAEAVLTSDECETGSDRVLEALKKRPLLPRYALNLQGDAPFTPVSVVRQMLEGFNEDTQVITPVHRLSWADLDRLREAKQTTPFSGTTAIVKNGQAIWFSKNIIPAIRKEDREQEPSPVYQHMGVYGYRVDILERFCALPVGEYERLEGLEQLRMLENDIAITAVEVEIEAGAIQSGIDTPEDLARAENFLKNHG